MYCQHCGNAVTEPAAEVAEAELAEAAGEAAADATVEVADKDVEIARIMADKEITLAKIERGVAAQAIEAQTEIAEVKADLLDQALTPPEPEAVPVEVVEPGGETDDGETAGMDPPELEPPAPESGDDKSRWDWF